MDLCSEFADLDSPFLKFMFESHGSWNSAIFELFCWANAVSGAQKSSLLMLYQSPDNMKYSVILDMFKAMLGSTKASVRGYAAFLGLGAFGRASTRDATSVEMNLARLIFADPNAKLNPVAVRAMVGVMHGTMALTTHTVPLVLVDGDAADGIAVFRTKHVVCEATLPEIVFWIRVAAKSAAMVKQPDDVVQIKAQVIAESRLGGQQNTPEALTRALEVLSDFEPISELRLVFPSRRFRPARGSLIDELLVAKGISDPIATMDMLGYTRSHTGRVTETETAKVYSRKSDGVQLAYARG